MGVSFKPDQMVKGGGLFEEGQGVIRNPRFKKHTYPKKGGTGLGQSPTATPTTAPVTVACFDLEYLGINEQTQAPELKTEECIYSVGTGMEPSKDNLTIALDGVGTFLISPLSKKLVESTNWAEFSRRLWQCATETMTAVEFDQDIAALDGLPFYFKREKQPKRDIQKATGINPNPALAAAQAAQAAQAREATYVMPVYPIAPAELLWANGVPATLAAAAPAVAAPVAAPAAPRANVVPMAPRAAAAPAVASAPQAVRAVAAPVAAAAAVAAAPAANPLADEAAQVLLAALAKAGGVMEQNALPTAIYEVIKNDLKDLTPKRAEILKVVRDPGFLASVPGVSVANGLITAS